MAERPKYSLRKIFQYGSLNHEKDVTCMWNSSDSLVIAGDYFELYRKLGGEKGDNAFAIVDLFNLLGHKGWELVSSHEEEQAQDYLFKRTYYVQP